MKSLLFATLLTLPALTQQAPTKALEPTNAREAAEKKAAANKALEEKYQAWKATLSPEKHKW